YFFSTYLVTCCLLANLQRIYIVLLNFFLLTINFVAYIRGRQLTVLKRVKDFIILKMILLEMNKLN
ncbi:hypothetical protein MUK42_33429, partial [Musa troglodytarum]